MKANKWAKETIKRYGLKLVLKEPWICLFLTQSQLKEETKNRKGVK